MRRALASAALAALAVLAVPALAGPTYGPPYEQGPSSTGDGRNVVLVDPASGTVTVLRANPAPGVFNCGGSGGFGYLEVRHTVAEPVAVVSVSYAEAVVDPYTWIKASVRDAAGRWLGASQLRGPLVGSGVLEVPLWAPSPPPGGQVTVLFGIEVASACPNVDGGRARFASVAVG